VVVGVDAWVDTGAFTAEVFVRIHSGSIENSRELYFELDGAVEVEDPIDHVSGVC